PAGSLNQISLSAVDSWQIFQPLLVIYGFDYSRFVGSAAPPTGRTLPPLALRRLGGAPERERPPALRRPVHAVVAGAPERGRHARRGRRAPVARELQLRGPRHPV